MKNKLANAYYKFLLMKRVLKKIVREATRLTSTITSAMPDSFRYVEYEFISPKNMLDKSKKDTAATAKNNAEEALLKTLSSPKSGKVIFMF